MFNLRFDFHIRDPWTWRDSQTLFSKPQVAQLSSHFGKSRHTGQAHVDIVHARAASPAWSSGTSDSLMHLLIHINIGTHAFMHMLVQDMFAYLCIRGC